MYWNMDIDLIGVSKRLFGCMFVSAEEQPLLLHNLIQNGLSDIIEIENNYNYIQAY